MHDMKTKIILTAAALALSVASFAQPDVTDPRTRTYVMPKRIVWQSNPAKFDDGWQARCAAEKMEMLLEPKHGQVSEVAFAAPTGCKLVNRNEPASVILDLDVNCTAACSWASARRRRRTHACA